jgi:Ribbon-helix-helix protein, copG family
MIRDIWVKSVRLALARIFGDYPLVDDILYDIMAFELEYIMGAKMVASTRERKSKFTASVRENLVTLLDAKVAQLKVNRSDAVERAIELWLRKLAEEEEEAYFSTAASEMNEDASAWNATTSYSARRTWE